MPQLRPCSRRAPSPRPRRRPSIAGCPLLPKTFPTNQRVDHLPILPGSAAITASIGLDTGLHADFGSGRYEGRPIGIPYDVVARAHAEEPRALRLRRRVRPRPLPDPARGPHRGRPRRRRRPPRAAARPRACRLYELFDLQGRPGAWTRGLGRDVEPALDARLRPAGWTSADAAGLPILPLLARHGEVKRGRIDHALRVTVRRDAARLRLPGPALRLATRTTRRCRGWASGCG